jgi:hypothetical protein
VAHVKNNGSKIVAFFCGAGWFRLLASVRLGRTGGPRHPWRIIGHAHKSALAPIPKTEMPEIRASGSPALAGKGSAALKSRDMRTSTVRAIVTLKGRACKREQSWWSMMIRRW